MLHTGLRFLAPANKKARTPLKHLGRRSSDRVITTGFIVLVGLIGASFFGLKKPIVRG